MNGLPTHYSSHLVDCQITDTVDENLEQLNPEALVTRLAQTGSQAAMISACCCNGNCYDPTVVGHIHDRFQAEMIAAIPEESKER